MGQPLRSLTPIVPTNTCSLNTSVEAMLRRHSSNSELEQQIYGTAFVS